MKITKLGLYLRCVCLGVWACKKEEDKKEIKKSPLAATLLAPENKAVITGLTPTLNWGGGGGEYLLI